MRMYVLIHLYIGHNKRRVMKAIHAESRGGAPVSSPQRPLFIVPPCEQEREREFIHSRGKSAARNIEDDGNGRHKLIKNRPTKRSRLLIKLTILPLRGKWDDFVNY